MTPIGKSFALALLIITINAAAALAQPDTGLNKAALMYCLGPSKSDPPVRRWLLTRPVVSTFHRCASTAILPTADAEATKMQETTAADKQRINDYFVLGEALKTVAGLALIQGHMFGILYLIKTMSLSVKTHGNVFGGLAKGFTFISVGLLSPSFVNWAVSTAHDVAKLN
jgi:hypothetical protein